MNVLFILSDQHNAAFTGCYGHPMACTPNIDSLARRGTRFESAYTVSPFCVPGRAAMFSGRYAHEISVWDNTRAYRGTPASWARYFHNNRVKVTTVGKLDFAPGADCGIEQELLAHHRNSMDICALFRDQLVPRKAMHLALKNIKPRTLDEKPTFDMQVRDRAIDWLRNERPADRPWVLNVNFVEPHPGWRPREDIWARYEGTIKSLSEKYFQPMADLHPANQAFSIHSCGQSFTPEEVYRCHEAYLAVIEELDEHVGKLLSTLESEGILDDTLVIYCSDHGELMRAHAAWSKCSMYEDSIRVPWVMAGPGVPAGHVDTACVSHLDMFPTICEALGLPQPWDKRGISLLSGERPPFVLSEFHGNGFPDGVFAIRCGKWKLVETANQRPQLYNLETDPDEMHDLLEEPEVAPAVLAKLRELRGMLGSICSPEAVDLRAKRDQAMLKAELEGSGRLLDELAKRGFERRTDCLVNVEQTTAASTQGP